jgi:ABC-2 type transport system permease protein
VRRRTAARRDVPVKSEVEMTNQKSAFGEQARVVWAIASKDISEALRNKNTLGVIFSSLFMVVLYRMLPILNARLEPSPVLVYDAGDSTLGVYLENSEAVSAHTGYDSQEEMVTALAKGDVPELGVVIPEGFDQALADGREMPLKGYVSYWLSDSQATAIRQSIEAEVARLLGRPVTIELQAEKVYTVPGPDGAGTQAAMAMVYVFCMIGISMVPHLMLEEKQSRTLEVLLTSPASEAQVILAKALAGLFYCLLGGAVILGINHAFVVHWGLTALAVVCFSLFVVSLGLWVGTKAESRAQLSIMVWPFLIPLLFPVILYLLGDLLPDIVARLIVVLPSATMLVVMGYSFAGSIGWAAPLVGLGWILLCTGAALVATVRLARQRDRQAEEPARPKGESVATRAPAVGIPRRQAEGIADTRRAQAIPEPHPHISRLPSTLRIFAALVAKDLREAMNNRLILSILLGAAFMVFNAAALPWLIESRMKPTAIVYDEGRSTIIRGLSAGGDLTVGFAESRTEMEEAISEGIGTRLGLVIPAGFDARAGSGQPIELDGFIAHWANSRKVQQLTSLFEERLGLAAWAPVQINLDGHPLFPGAKAGGQIGLNVFTMVIAVSVIGVALVPLLLVEEKEAHTLEVVLVSPAKPNHIMSAKAAVGGAYCLLTLCVVTLFNAKLFVHWGVLLLAAGLTVAFVVGVGLLVGILADSPTSAAFWGGPLLLLLIASAFVELWVMAGASAAAQAVATWLPGSLMMNLFRLAAAGQFPPGQFWMQAGGLAAMSVVAYLLLGWRLRRWGQ